MVVVQADVVEVRAVEARRRRGGAARLDYLPPRPNFMKISSLPLLRMSPPGAVISVNFCIRLGCVVGGTCAALSGCAEGAGTTAGPARRAGEGAAGACPSGVPATPPVPTPAAPATPATPGDCAVGVLALPTLVRAIVLGG